MVDAVGPFNIFPFQYLFLTLLAAIRMCVREEVSFLSHPSTSIAVLTSDYTLSSIYYFHFF